MNRVELEGVIGHEMSHVVDRDILLRHDRRDRDRRRRVALGVLPAELVVGRVRRAPERRGNGNGGGRRSWSCSRSASRSLILAPLFGQLIQLAVSRNREYLADAQGAMLTRYPPGLISALKKIKDAPHAMRSANNATAHLWLDQPSRVQGRADRTDGEALLDPPADRGADPAPRGDVTIRSR